MRISYRYPASRLPLVLAFMSGSLCHAGTPKPAPRSPVPVAALMPSLIERFTADRMSLSRKYPLVLSPAHVARFETFYKDELASLAAIDFNSLSQEDKVDYLLLKNRLTANLHQLAIAKHQTEEMQPLLPFAATIEAIVDKQRLMERPDAEHDASLLSALVKQFEDTRKQLDPNSSPVPGHGEQASAETTAQNKFKIDPVVANRAVEATHELSVALKSWFTQYNGYDPTFTWWVALPYKNADKALSDYTAFLKEKLIGIKPDDTTTISAIPSAARPSSTNFPMT